MSLVKSELTNRLTKGLSLLALNILIMTYNQDNDESLLLFSVCYDELDEFNRHQFICYE